MSTVALRWRQQWQRVRAARADLRASRARAEQLVGISAELSGELLACREELAEVSRRVDELSSRTAAEHQRTMEALRVVRDQDAATWERLWELRRSDDYSTAFEDPRPLVTILVTTYDRTRLLRELALPSVLAQTYERFECIVVGDAAPPEAAEAVASLRDERLRFVNLPYRGPYPADPADAWLIGGTAPFNTGLALAAGRWIGGVNDDDVLSPTYIERLLEVARAERAEVAYGQFRYMTPGADPAVLGRFPPESGQWSVPFSLIHSGLRFLPLQPTDWLWGAPHDTLLLERMLRIGVRFAMLEEPVGDYYPSQLWPGRS